MRLPGGERQREFLAELHEVLAGERPPARQSVRVEAFTDDSAEQLAADVECLTPAQHRTRRLPLERRRVDGALAGDDEVCAARALVEAGQVEDELRAVEQ